MIATLERITLGNPVEREFAPSLAWVREKEEKSPFKLAEEKFAQWNRLLNACEQLFKQHVYENPDFDLFDARQHRASLHKLIADGEQLAIDFLALNVPDESKPYVSVIDQKTRRLTEELWEWHGPPKVPAVFPEDFIQGMQETIEGRVVDFEKALNEPPV